MERELLDVLEVTSATNEWLDAGIDVQRSADEPAPPGRMLGRSGFRVFNIDPERALRLEKVGTKDLDVVDEVEPLRIASICLW